ncbi:MAG: hypothetical protein AB1593_06805 [Pseudomonadota bacterium]
MKIAIHQSGDVAQPSVLAEKFIHFIRTGEDLPGLFDQDVFLDFTPPHWRLQSLGRDDAVRVRHEGHPWPSEVPHWRSAPIPNGFVIEWEEVWRNDGQLWYCREMAWCQTGPGGIVSLAVYCTGDWDEKLVAAHALAGCMLQPL